MNDEAWAKLTELYETLLGQSQAERERALAVLEDRELAQELAAMLEAGPAGESFLMPPEIDEVREVVGERPRIGEVLVDRYRLLGSLGEGAQGCVFRAEDRLVGEHVAVKWMVPGDADAWRRARRETAVLRLLRIPHVVSLLDDGRIGNSVFVVMELAAGKAFPTGAVPFDDLAPLAAMLLGALSRLHRSGVIHGDLKPSNVLVDERGDLTVLDLGIAGGPAVWTRTQDAVFSGGTPTHLAPELIMGNASSVASDLFAVGVILHQALTGELPRIQPDPSQPFAAVLGMASRAETVWPDDVPAEAAETIRALLAALPGDRPRDAEEALLRLLPGGLSSDATIRAVVEGAATATDLFDGPDRIFQARIDAASELERRAGPDRGSWSAELSQWMRRGWIEVEADRLRVSPDAVATLRSEAELAALVTDAADDSSLSTSSSMEDWNVRALELVQRSQALTERALNDGRAELAEALARQGLMAARAIGRPESERELLGLGLRAAGVLGTAGAFDRLLYEIGRVEESNAEIEQLETMARAARAGISGDWRRSLRLIDACAPEDPFLLEVHHLIGLRAARRGPLDEERARVKRATEWAEQTGDAEHQALVSLWRGWVEYRSGRFFQAAELHAAAAAKTDRPGLHRVALLDAASSCMEGGDLKRASSFVAEARLAQEGTRLVQLEARAEWLDRALRYRSGAALEVDEELLEALPFVEIPNLVGLITINEAAIAWRAGALVRASELARETEDCWRRAGREVWTVLPRALAAACGRALGPVERLDMRERIRSTPPPSFALQALALLVSTSGGASEAEREELLALYERIPEAQRGLRCEVLSADEALELAGAK